MNSVVSTNIIPTKHPTVVSPENHPIPTFVPLSGIVPVRCSSQSNYGRLGQFRREDVTKSLRSHNEVKERRNWMMDAKYRRNIVL